MSFEEVFLVWKEGAEWLCREILTGGSNSDSVVLSPMSRVHVCFLFSVFFFLVSFCFYGYMCVHVPAHATAHVCKSEDNLWESFLTFHNVGSKD